MIVKNDMKALILGVGNAQVDAIRYLKSRDWYVIGCSYKAEGVGLALVDQFELVNIINVEEIQELASKNEVQFVYSIGSDIAMPTVAKVSQILGLPSFITPEQADILHNKMMVRKLLGQNNISPVKFTSVKNLDEALQWNIFPSIIKPVDSQGQRGVFQIDAIKDLCQQFSKSISFSKSNSVIIEEYLDGPEISANVFVHKGKIIFNMVSDREVVAGTPGGLPHSHHLPSQKCVGRQLELTEVLIQKCIDVIGIENGPVYFQIKLTDNGPRIIEIAPRLDGCHLWRLIKHFCDIDLLDMTFQLLNNQELDTQTPIQHFKTIQLAFSYLEPGKYFHARDFFMPNNLIYYENYYSEGEVVHPINGFLEKTGYMIIGER